MQEHCEMCDAAFLENREPCVHRVNGNVFYVKMLWEKYDEVDHRLS